MFPFPLYPAWVDKEKVSLSFSSAAEAWVWEVFLDKGISVLGIKGADHSKAPKTLLQPLCTISIISSEFLQHPGLKSRSKFLSSPSEKCLSSKPGCVHLIFILILNLCLGFCLWVCWCGVARPRFNYRNINKDLF